MWNFLKRKATYLLAGAVCAGAFASVAHADPVAANWDAFTIRTVAGALTPVVPVESASQQGITVNIDEGGEKAGYGTNVFDGQSVNNVQSVSYTRVDAGAPDPYVNIWVTDGSNYAVIAPVTNMQPGGGYTSNDVNGLSLQTLGFNVYETSFANLNWLYGGAQRLGQGLMKADGTPVLLGDLSASILVDDPGFGNYSAFVGSGAPKNNTGFNLIFGDTQGNFVSPLPYHLENVTVSGAGNQAVPLPAVAWAGMALFGGIAAKRKRGAMQA